MCLFIIFKLDNIDDVFYLYIGELELWIFDLCIVICICKIKNFDMYICLNSFWRFLFKNIFVYISL